MKKIVLALVLLLSFQGKAQTGIGTTTPNASAKLEVYATNKGFLPPRIALLSTSDVATIASPASGLIIYNTATAGTSPTNVLPGYYYWDGSKWNGMVNQGSLNAFSGYNPNYAQSNASSVTKSAVGDIVVSQSITTSGRPIQIIASGDANPLSSNGWIVLQLYRDGTAIGKKVQAESSLANENVPYCLNFIDSPTAGTYTYSVKINGLSNSFQFGEADGNQITLLELGAWSAGTMPVSKGGTGSTSYTAGSVMFSDGTNITQNNSKLFWNNSNYRLGIGNASPTQALDVTGTGKFSTSVINSGSRTYFGKDGSNMHWFGTTDAISEPYNLGYGFGSNGSSIQSHKWNIGGIEKMLLNASGNLGLGTTLPATTLHIENGNLFGTPASTSSPGIYVLNNNNSSTTAHATALVRTAGTGGGKPFYSLDVANGFGFSMGINNPTDQLIFNTTWDFNLSAANNALIINESGMSRVIIPSQLGVLPDGTWPYGWGGGLMTWDISCSGVYYNVLTARSDRRLKNTIVDVKEEAISNYLKLRPVNYYWNDGSDNKHLQYGLIAQEVEPLFPEMVSTGDDSMQTKSVNYQALHALSLKVIQSQQAEIEALKKKQVDIEARLLQLEAKLN